MNPSQRKLEMALPFIRGEAFIVSVLDAILSLVNTYSGWPIIEHCESLKRLVLRMIDTEFERNK